VLRFIGSIFLDSYIFRLIVREDRELGTDTLEVESCHFLIEMLRETVYSDGIGSRIREELDLSESLIGEASRHDE
jgi:hypothetical protein